MANLQYRGVKFDSEGTVKKASHIVQYRGSSYNTEDVEKVQSAHEGNYRGVKWTN